MRAVVPILVALTCGCGSSSRPSVDAAPPDAPAALPNLTIDTAAIVASAEVVVRVFPADSCELDEACVGGPGPRALLRFTLRTPNAGDGDLHLGAPADNPLFTFSDCHGHYHFSDYAWYRLLDVDGNVVADGHKQGFCLLDGDRWRDDAPPERRYDCEDQGIQAGWADTYDRSLPCQWVDVSGVPAGAYQLEVELNPMHGVVESDYADNVARVTVELPASTCPGGCTAPDEACCRDGDPCALAANGACNCGGLLSWDAADCALCLAAEPACPPTTTCEAGCTPPGGACCAEDDPCNLGWNGACDCGNTWWWEWDDCEACVPLEEDCFGHSTCPGGCTPDDGSGCCDPADPCGLANDGVCDCAGAQPWDGIDCGRCTSPDPDCPPFDSCPGGCLPYEPGDCCEYLGDRCGRALNGICDCGGWMSWDEEDCAFCACP